MGESMIHFRFWWKLLKLKIRTQIHPTPIIKFRDNSISSPSQLEQLSHGVDHSRQHLGLVALIAASFLSSLGFVCVEWTVSWFAREQTPVWKEFFHLSAAIFYYAVRFASLCPLVVFVGGLLALRARFRKLNDAFRWVVPLRALIDAISGSFATLASLVRV